MDLSKPFNLTKSLLLASLVYVQGLTGFASTPLDDSLHEEWTAELQKFVTKSGNVDYLGWKDSRDALDTYTNKLEQVEYEAFQAASIAEKRAFLINAYNAFTVKLILDKFPVSSIRQIGRPFSSAWKLKFFNLLDGQIQTLDGIEHTWLRGKQELFDPRVHAVVNCASISCPILAPKAYLASNLEEQMQEAMDRWLKDESKNLISKESASIELSMIFKWYGQDFEGGNIRAYLVGELADDFGAFGFSSQADFENYLLQKPIKHLRYDWNLNSQN